jgi:hypothetical protein
MMIMGDLNRKGIFSNALKAANISVNRYAEVTGWDRRSVVNWCKNGVPEKLGQAVFETFCLWNALVTFPTLNAKEKPYAKRRAPNQPNSIYKYDLIKV